MTTVHLSRVDTNNLPTRIRIHSGSCGIEEDDQIDLYFAKYTKMVEIMSSSGKRYVVPVSSSLKCCVLYDPEHDAKKAIKGYTFATASELASAKPLPSMVRAEAGYMDPESETVIHPEDIFILSGKTSRGNEIVCTDIETFKSHTITIQFQCPFTTKPSSLYMLLANFINQVETPVSIAFELLIRNGKTDTYTIIDVFTAKSVVGRIKRPGEREDEVHQLIELFLDVPLRVEVLADNNTDNSMQRLRNDAQTAFNIFRPSTGRRMIINSSLYDNDDTQRLLLNTISIDQWNSYVYLQPLKL